MNDQLTDFVIEEIKDWNRIIFDVVKIPRPVFMECIPSGFFVELNKSARGLNPEKAKDTEEKFDRLCQSVPHIRRECVQLISKSYGALLLMLSSVNRDIDAKVVTRALLEFSMAKGAVLSMMPEAPLLMAYQNDVNQKQSEKNKVIGKSGGIEKAKYSRKLKAWACLEAEKMSGFPVQKAIKLAINAPKELTHDANGNVRLKNPQRIIYEGLLKNNKKPS